MESVNNCHFSATLARVGLVPGSKPMKDREDKRASFLCIAEKGREGRCTASYGRHIRANHRQECQRKPDNYGGFVPVPEYGTIPFPATNPVFGPLPAPVYGPGLVCIW